jgi:hypothetical protein
MRRRLPKTKALAIELTDDLPIPAETQIAPFALVLG